MGVAGVVAKGFLSSVSALWGGGASGAGGEIGWQSLLIEPCSPVHHPGTPVFEPPGVVGARSGCGHDQARGRGAVVSQGESRCGWTAAEGGPGRELGGDPR